VSAKFLSEPGKGLARYLRLPAHSVL
jgi:hypothetical protein